MLDKISFPCSSYPLFYFLTCIIGPDVGIGTVSTGRTGAELIIPEKSPCHSCRGGNGGNTIVCLRGCFALSLRSRTRVAAHAHVRVTHVLSNNNGWSGQEKPNARGRKHLHGSEKHNKSLKVSLDYFRKENYEKRSAKVGGRFSSEAVHKTNDVGGSFRRTSHLLYIVRSLAAKIPSPSLNSLPMDEGIGSRHCPSRYQQSQHPYI